jgi:Cys-tRNA(Pro)/Cys-tRNA(Cys) deacylase
MKTNAARILDGLGIAYTPQEYEVDPEDLRATTVAAKIGMPPEQVFKTLARAAGVRKAEMASLKDVQPLTGYIRGGVTVLGAKKAYPAFADETIELFDVVSVSAGHRGVQIVLSPADYLRATGATLAGLSKDQA